MNYTVHGGNTAERIPSLRAWLHKSRHQNNTFSISLYTKAWNIRASIVQSLNDFFMKNEFVVDL